MVIVLLTVGVGLEKVMSFEMMDKFGFTFAVFSPSRFLNLKLHCAASIKATIQAGQQERL